MYEDTTRRLPDRPDGSEEFIRLVQTFRAELAELKQTGEARRHDTRPVWEKVQADIEKMQADVSQLRDGQQRLEQRLEAGQKRLEERLEASRDDTRTGLLNRKRDFGTMYETFI